MHFKVVQTCARDSHLQDFMFTIQRVTDRLAVITILTCYQSTVKRVSKFILFLNFLGIVEPNSSHVSCIIMFFAYEYTLLESHGKIKISAYKKVVHFTETKVEIVLRKRIFTHKPYIHRSEERRVGKEC